MSVQFTSGKPIRGRPRGTEPTTPTPRPFQWKTALATVIPITASKAPGKRGATISNPTMTIKTANAMNNVGTSSTVSFTISNPVSNVLQNGVGITIADATANHQQNWTMADRRQKPDKNGTRQEIGEETQAQNPGQEKYAGRHQSDEARESDVPRRVSGE